MNGAIRPATAADFGALLDLYAEVGDLHFRFASHTFRRPEDPMRTREWLAEIAADPRTLLLLAEIDAAPAGLVEAVVAETKPLPFLVQKRFVTVNTLAVSSRYRRQGVGRALMAAVGEWGREREAAEVQLTVYDGNRAAQSFYESLGFQTVKRELRLPLVR